MDRHKHRLSCVGELPQESEDVERRLTVESRGRFVEEEQDRFGDQLRDRRRQGNKAINVASPSLLLSSPSTHLDSDRDSLPLLDTKT